MEGVLAASWRPHVILDCLDEREFSIPLDRVVVILRQHTHKRVRCDHVGPLSWAMVCDLLARLLPHVDTDLVFNFLTQPAIVEIDSDVDAADPSAHSAYQCLQRENSRLKNKVYNLKRQVARLRKQCRPPDVPESECSALALVMRGEHARYFTPQGGFVMAVRRLASGVSANRFGLSSNMDVAHTTVCKWEVQFCAALQGWRKAWYADQEMQLLNLPVQPQDHRVMRFVVHIVRGDATNTLKFKSKLHTTEVRSTYFAIDADGNTSWSDLQCAAESMRSVGDLLKVESGGAAEYHLTFNSSPLVVGGNMLVF
jgi:hypothetical protein